MPSNVLEVPSVHARVSVTSSGNVFHLLDEAESFSERNGGAISRWAANVLRNGKETIVCPSFDSSWKFEADRLYELPRWKDTDRIHPLLYRMPWSLQKKFYLRTFSALLERMKSGDVLYIHNRPECASVLSTVAAEHGITVVLHMHNSHLTESNRGQIEALKKTPIVFCSNFLRSEIHRKFPNHFENTFVVYNGADAEKFRTKVRVPNAMPMVIFSGRLVPYKGVHVLMDAMRLLEQRGVNIRCQIVGGSGFGDKRSTPYVRKLESNCPGNTELLGYKSGSALAELLRNADIFCCPSIWNDPFPLAPLEAMACGLPVVASRTGGIPEALAYGGGVMVPPDQPQALAAALEDLAGDFIYRQRLSEEAVRSVYENFLWRNVRAQYMSVLERLLQ